MYKHTLKQKLLMSLGLVSIGLGLIGVFVPLMPTTCFLIAAAWCFAWADKKCFQSLINHKKLGPLIKKIPERFLPKAT